jgi:hypothetical protein
VEFLKRRKKEDVERKEQKGKDKDLNEKTNREQNTK